MYILMFSCKLVKAHNTPFHMSGHIYICYTICLCGPQWLSTIVLEVHELETH